MALKAAESRFQEGLAALAAGRPAEASEHFKAALTLEKEHGALRPRMRHLSYYGLSLARAHRPTVQAVRLCEVAARQDPHDPECLLNLGRVYLMIGKTTSGLATLERGLRIEPGHDGLKRELAHADRRGRPVLPGAGRDHPLNRWLGRLLARFRATGRRESAA
jgi:tetratricopeptide (TPR) repeat protein